MKTRMLSKGLVVAVIILFLGVGIQPAIAITKDFINHPQDKPDIKNQLSFIDEEKENIIFNYNPDYFGSIKRKVYLGCQVKTPTGGIIGLALLFPGILRTINHNDELLFIKMNSGIIINDENDDRLYLDDDIYEGFLFVNIVGFTGYFKIITNILRIPEFYLSGKAHYIVIYYK